jgi:hypothetical protein
MLKFVMEKIIIETIPDKEQRYNTVGDYYFDKDGNRLIMVSDFSNWKYELLIAVHELIEVSLCKDRGVTDAAIDEFDFAFEEARLINKTTTEPGNEPDAPYFMEHQFASKVEKMLAEQLNVNWQDYITTSKRLDINT